jgi:hypothetical protein
MTDDRASLCITVKLFLQTMDKYQKQKTKKKNTSVAIPGVSNHVTLLPFTT